MKTHLIAILAASVAFSCAGYAQVAQQKENSIQAIKEANLEFSRKCAEYRYEREKGRQLENLLNEQEKARCEEVENSMNSGVVVGSIVAVGAGLAWVVKTAAEVAKFWVDSTACAFGGCGK